MFYVVKYLFNQGYELYAQHADPRVKNWPLVYSPLPMATAIGLYLMFVLHYGPKWMQNRQPYQLKYIMRIYNAIQVITNLILFVIAVPNSYGHKNFSFTCQPPTPNNTEPWMMRCLYVTYGYYLSKYVDLFDTIFIILRKRNKQVTFLHVYHHAGMVFGVYIYMTFLPGSHSTMLGVINLLVHVVMYSYYLLASLRSESSTLWWKRHITQMQLVQFGYLAFHFLQVLLHNPCGHPLFISMVGFIQNLFMFALFFNFYYKNYMKKHNTNGSIPQKDAPQNQQTKSQLKSS